LPFFHFCTVLTMKHVQEGTGGVDDREKVRDSKGLDNGIAYARREPTL
jgi:hypothetical protein